jgi:hypothetical protein
MKEQATEKKAGTADTVSTNFVDVLRDIRKGQFLYECSAEMESLIAKIREHGKAGALNIKITITPHSVGNGDTLDVLAEVGSKKPKATPPKAIFFSTNRNTLQRNDPKQGDFLDGQI